MSTHQLTLNDFQKRVDERLNVALDNLGLRVDSRRIGKEKVPFLSAEPEVVIYVRAQDLSVAIREDSASFTIAGKDDYYEMQDYPNPDALADALLAELTKRWRTHPRK